MDMNEGLSAPFSENYKQLVLTVVTHLKLSLPQLNKIIVRDKPTNTFMW